MPEPGFDDPTALARHAVAMACSAHAEELAAAQREHAAQTRHAWLSGLGTGAVAATAVWLVLDLIARVMA